MHSWFGGGGLDPNDRLVLEVRSLKPECSPWPCICPKPEDYGIFSFQLDAGPESEDMRSVPVKTATSNNHQAQTDDVGAVSILADTYHGKNPQSRNSLIGIDAGVQRGNALSTYENTHPVLLAAPTVLLSSGWAPTNLQGARIRRSQGRRR